MKQNSAFDRRLYTLFNQALDLDSDARARMLGALHADEPELAECLDRMLADDAEGEQCSGTTDSLHAALAGMIDGSESGELPTRIGAYRIEGKLGEGGMGIVYLARREGLADAPAVALKLISERLRSSAAKNRFLGEQRSLARLDHPAVCRFIDAATLPDGRPLVVMEAVRGQPIDVWVASQRPSVNALLELVLQLLSAVAHAHERLIVHRDIKCSNVLVTDGGQIKLLDFGIAKLMDAAETSQVTATSERFLTPGIAAPEYWSRGEVTVATDIYALGALLYRLFAGRDALQIEGLKPAEIERQLLFVEPAALAQSARGHLRSKISRDLEAIVHKCLRKSPAERYGSTDALAADLRRLLGGFPVRARATPPLYRTRLFLRRNLATVVVIATAAATLIAWTLSLSASLREVEHQRAEAVRARESSDTIAQLLESAIVEADPARRSIENIGAREIMEAAALRVEGLREMAPDAHARMTLILARIQAEYGHNDEAYDLGTRGLQYLQGAQVSEELQDQLRLVTALAAIRIGRNSESAALLGSLSENTAPHEPSLAIARSLLLLESSEYAEVERILTTAISQPDGSNPAVQSSHALRWTRTDALERSGRYAEAAQAADDMLAWQRQHLPEHHAWVLNTRLKRLAFWERSRPGDEVDHEYAEVLHQVRELFGEDSPTEALLLARRGDALYRRGDYAASALASEEAARIRLLTKRTSDPGFLRIMTNLGVALIKVGDPASLARAVEVLILVDTEVTQQFGAQSPFAVHIKSMLARSLVRSQRSVQAVRLLADEASTKVHTISNSATRKSYIETLDEVLASTACIAPNSWSNAPCEKLRENRNRIQSSLDP